MTLKEFIAKTSLKTAGQRAGLDVRMVEGRLECTPINPDEPHPADFIIPSMSMINACRADDFDFFQPFLDAGRITVEDMHRTAARYHLGKTKSGQPIYWMIDDMLDPLDAHIMPDTWISTLLKAREPLLQYWRPTHCLFGLHLLCYTESARSVFDAPICIVESEASAVVLSALFPQCLWMAYARMPLLDVSLFAPLQDRTVTIYPCTDDTAANYDFFKDFAQHVRRRYPSITLEIDNTLESNATDNQKARCIDVLDFLREAT